MKIAMPLVNIKDQLISFLAEGYAIVGDGFQLPNSYDYIKQNEIDWSNRVRAYLSSTFPTKKEEGQFIYTTYTAVSYTGMDYDVADVVSRANTKVKILEVILDKLTTYYEFEPDSKRLFIQSIDTFSNVRDVNHTQVLPFLRNGYLEWAEDEIKKTFIAIIGQSYIPKDWGGENEDIYPSRILLNGERVQASIILKGSGTVRGVETRQKDLGKNGDQLVRMMRITSSKLYIVQSVKPIASDIVDTLEAFVDQQRARGNHCYYCTIDGEDTALILFAYGFLK